MVACFLCGSCGIYYSHEAIGLPLPCPFFVFTRQPIIAHEQCQRIQKINEFSVDYQSDEQSHNGTDSTSGTGSDAPFGSKHVQTCLICLECFHVGEIASWSSTKDCNHAFHPSCIEKWLLRHENCPICRRMIMLCDYSHQKIPKTKLKALRKEYKKRGQSTHFCIQDGLVLEDLPLVEKEFQQSDIGKLEVDGLCSSLPAVTEVDQDASATCGEEGNSEELSVSINSEDEDNGLYLAVVELQPCVVSCFSTDDCSSSGRVPNDSKEGTTDSTETALTDALTAV